MSRSRCLALVGLVLSILGPSAPAAEGHKLRVLTSFLPVYCFTVNVAGSLAEVENLLPANIEPHDYQFSRKDLQKLAHADLVLLNGLGLEKWLEKAIQNAGAAHPQTVVAIARGMEPELIYPSHLSHSSYLAVHPQTALPNPHIWLDPHLARQAVTNILEALQQADPAHASGYAANAAAYAARLEQLDATLQQGLEPVRGAPMVTYHDAFAYFARRYGLEIIGVIEPVPDLEPSLKYLAALYRSIRASQVRAIFTEPPAPSLLARQIGADLHLPLPKLDTMETGPLTPTAYEDTMKSNLRVLLKYLKPDAQTAAR